MASRRSRRSTPAADDDSADVSAHLARLYRAIHDVVRRIPRGRVATYGQVAELAGLPGGARVAGAAMKTLPRGHRLPWQRVIGKAGRNRGRIAIHNPVGAAIQRQLLDAEGVPIGDTGLIALDRYGWLPASERLSAAASPRTRRSASTRAAQGTPRKRSRARR